MEGRSVEYCDTKKAREFVNDVKCRFIQVNQRDKYYDFLKVLVDYKKQRFDHVWQLFFFIVMLDGFY